MKSVLFVVLVSIVAFAAGVEKTSYKKILQSVKSTRSVTDDLAIIDDYLNSCPAALAYVDRCVDSFVPTEGTAEVCAIRDVMAILLDCLDGAFTATTCPGEQAAIDASARVRIYFDEACEASGSASTFVVTGIFTVILIACVDLLV